MIRRHDPVRVYTDQSPNAALPQRRDQLEAIERRGAQMCRHDLLGYR